MRSVFTQAVRCVGWFLLAGMVATNARAADGPVTDDEVAAWAETLEKATAKGDAHTFASQIDWDVIMDKVMEGVDAPQKFREAFRKGMMDSIEKPNTLVGIILAQVKRGGTYNLLRARVKQKHKTALFRLALANGGGVNYHEFTLSRRPDGKVRATDMYVVFTGESIIETFRHLYVPAAARTSQGLFARLTGADQDLVKGSEKILELSELSAAGRNREVLEAFDKLPDPYKKNKTMMLLRLKAAQGLDEKSYSEAIDRYREAFPGDASVDVHSIDGFYLMKQYDKAFAAIDRLDTFVGGDPYLNVIRAGMYTETGKPEKALDAARAAVKGMPDTLSAYLTLLGVALKVDDHAATLKTLKLIDERFAVPFNDLSEVPEYARFVKSPQFDEWKAYLNKKAEGSDKKKP